MNTPRQESCFLAGALVEAWLLFLGRIEIEEGFFYMEGTEKVLCWPKS